MSSALFYPFRVASTSPLLSIDVPEHEVGRGSDGSLRLYELELPEVELRASVAVPDIRHEVLPEDERSDPPVEVHLICRSTESRRREAWRLVGQDIYEHRVILRTADWSGELAFQAVVVRTRSRGSDSGGFATDRGAVLAQSEIQRVLIDPPPLPPGSYLTVRWVNFEDDPRHRPHSDQLFALEMSGIQPELLLNSRIPGAVSVLDSRATTGPIARIRNATNYMIAHQVWSSLLASALAQLSELAGDGDPDPADLQPWQRGVLQDWAHSLLPEEPPDTAYTTLLRKAQQSDMRQDLLIRRLPTAIQGKLRTFRGFEDLVREAGAL